MGRVIAFSEFSSYLDTIRSAGRGVEGAILDTNILISLTYEVKSDHDEIRHFFSECLAPEMRRGMRLFTTVTTRSEFLDFNRRLFMTENLRDALDPGSPWRISVHARAQVQYQSGQLRRREQQGGDPVFGDAQLKAIKKVFSAGPFSGHATWLVLCEDFLAGRLDEAEDALVRLGVEYISPHEASVTRLSLLTE